MFKVSLHEGLTQERVASLRAQFGPNELPVERKQSALFRFLKQFNRGLTYVLFVAAGLSVWVGGVSDAIGILLAVLIDAVFGFVQERRAEGAMEALKGMVTYEASVIRDGKPHRIAASEVVPGDILRLEEGDRVSADARLIESRDLRTDESALTGESSLVNKSIGVVAREAGIGDQVGMVWMGTSVVGGRGLAVVTATGVDTAFGRIAHSIASIVRARTPLETRLDVLGRQLAIFSVVLSVVVFASGVARGETVSSMFFFAVALMVAVVPEGLPAVLAVVLALGVRRMAKRKAIVRHVPSVETLGASDVICTDKTGTLTENKMTVREIATASARVAVSGEGWEMEGEFTAGDRSIIPADTAELLQIMIASTMATRSFIEVRGDKTVVSGDPTEAAMVVLAAKAGFDRAGFEGERRLVDDIPFSSERRFRAALIEHTKIDGQKLFRAYIVGAFETVAERCTLSMNSGRVIPYQEAVSVYQTANEDMGKRALRTLAVARVELESEGVLSDTDLVGMTMLGLVGMIDPPRAGVREAVEKCRQAGIRIMMLTGDQKATATAIARDIGIINGETNGVFTESEVAMMTDEQFRKAVREATIFARVSPETKLRVVTALQADGHTVAMTGDGVNDAPALKKASIGIAMGLSGTDVARATADMILTDDHFVTIVNAVEQGRIVFRNVRQTTAYLLMTSLGEVVTVLAALLSGMPLPLLPAQILWLNLVIEGFPDVALATESGTNGLLDAPPRRRNEAILAPGTLLLSGLVAVVMGLISILSYVMALPLGEDHARTIAFTTLAVCAMWNVFTMRSLTESIFSFRPFSNKYVNLAVVVSVGLQAVVLYVPALQATFRTVPLGVVDIARIVVLTSLVAVTAEVYKAMARRGWVHAA